MKFFKNPPASQSDNAGKPSDLPIEHRPSGDDFQRLAARLDKLVGEFVALHTDILRAEGEQKLLSTSLTELFSEKLANGTARSLNPYEEVAPKVRIGFEKGATVAFTARRKEDFSRSPDRCLNTIFIDFSGTSEWLTLEFPISWNEVVNVANFQLGIYSEQDRKVQCRAVVRSMARNGPHVDHVFASLDLPEIGRSANRSGEIKLPTTFNSTDASELRLILFIDTKSSLVMRLDYLSIYFG